MTEDTVSRPDGLRTPMAIHLADNAEHEIIPGLLGIIASRVELAAIEAQAAALSTPPPSRPRRRHPMTRSDPPDIVDAAQEWPCDEEVNADLDAYAGGSGDPATENPDRPVSSDASPSVPRTYAPGPERSPDGSSDEPYSPMAASRFRDSSRPPAVGGRQILLAQVSEPEHLAKVISALPPYAWLRVAPFLVSEVFGLPFRHPDGYYVRLIGLDIYRNEDGSYEIDPTIQRTEAE